MAAPNGGRHRQCQLLAVSHNVLLSARVSCFGRLRHHCSMLQAVSVPGDAVSGEVRTLCNVLTLPDQACVPYLLVQRLCLSSSETRLSWVKVLQAGKLALSCHTLTDTARIYRARVRQVERVRRAQEALATANVLRLQAAQAAAHAPSPAPGQPLRV